MYIHKSMYVYVYVDMCIYVCIPSTPGWLGRRAQDQSPRTRAASRYPRLTCFKVSPFKHVKSGCLKPFGVCVGVCVCVCVCAHL